MKIGDRVKVTKGIHAGKSGMIVNTRGSHISNFVFVQLDRLIQGRLVASPPHPAYRVGVSIKSIEFDCTDV